MLGDGLIMSGWSSWVLARAVGCLVRPLTIIGIIGRMTDLMGKEDEFIFVHVLFFFIFVHVDVRCQ